MFPEMLHTCSWALSAWGSSLATNILAAVLTCHEGLPSVTAVVVCDHTLIYDKDQEHLGKDKGDHERLAGCY